MKTAGGRSHRQARSSWKGGVGARSQSGNCGREVLLKLIPEGWAQWVGHGWRGGAFQVDGTGYAKPSKLPSPLAPGAFPLSVGFIHFTLNISAFPWNVLLGREGGNQVPQIKLCDINNPLPRPLGGGWQAPWDAADRPRPGVLAAVPSPRTELRLPEPLPFSSWA